MFQQLIPILKNIATYSQSPLHYFAVACRLLQSLNLFGHGDFSALFVQDLVTYSPFYHYGQLALWSAGLDYDNKLVLHMLWLIWAGFMFSFLAIWAYRRDEVLQ